MRTTALLLLFAALLTFSQVRGEEATTACGAEITHVTVFPSYALVTRKCTADVEAGRSVLFIDNLPATINAGFTFVQAESGAKFIAAEYRLKTKVASRTEKDETEAETVSAKVKANDATLKAFANRLALLTTKKDFYQSLKPSEDIPSDKTADLSLAACQDLLEKMTDGLKAVKKERWEIISEQTELTKEQGKLRARLAQLSRPTSQYIEARITVDSDRPGRAALNMYSRMPDCFWNANYDSRLVEGGNVELSYFGDVAQRTGEDWTNVAMTLSTSSIASLNLPPELKKLTLVIEPQWEPAEEEEKVTGTYGHRAGGKRAQAKRADTFKSEQQQAAANAVAGGIAVEFNIPNPATVPCDGTKRRLLINKTVLSGKREYEIYPRLAQSAFLRVQLANVTAFPFVQGNLNVFTGSEYRGLDLLPAISTGASFKLYYGVDPSIEVKYKPLKRKVDAGRKNTDVDYEWMFEITNKRSDRVSVIVVDAQPFSENDEIQVKSLRCDPKPTEVTADKYAKWELDMAPGEKKEIRISVTIKAPTDREVYVEPMWEGGF